MSANTIITCVVTGGSSNHATVAAEANAMATDFVSQGVVGPITVNSGSGGTGAYCVNQDSSPDMGVTILFGVAYITATPSSQSSQVLRAYSTANYTGYTISANSSGSTKYDWIYLSVNATNANNPDSAADNVTSLVTSRSTSNTVDNGTPPTYGILLAVVTVANGASSITNANITDKRTLTSFNTGTSGSENSSGWVTLNTALTYVSNTGNKEFTLSTSNSTVGTLQPGMRLSVVRGTAPPTQCMAFVLASSQYATLASGSVTGMTDTGAFTIEAWVYLNSYGTGSDMGIVSRDSGGASGGMGLAIIASTGQFEIYYRNASGASVIASRQSVPLGRWVHLAGVVSTLSTQTGALYMNGALVASSATSSAATTRLQSGPLQVGAYNSTHFFDGYISEGRVWSQAQSQATIQANMAISLGATSGLTFMLQGNGNFNDTSGNGNNLTAQASAIATQANNPYNATEYAIITAVTSTTLTVFTGTAGTIPNQTLNTPLYSWEKVPYGWPAGREKWVVDTLVLNSIATSATVTSTVYNPGGLNLSVPVGEWFISYDFSVGATNSTSTTDVTTGMSMSNSAFGAANKLVTRMVIGTATNSAASVISMSKKDYVILTADTTYYALYISNAAFSAGGLRGIATSNTNESSQMVVESAYA